MRASEIMQKIKIDLGIRFGNTGALGAISQRISDQDTFMAACSARDNNNDICSLFATDSDLFICSGSNQTAKRISISSISSVDSDNRDNLDITVGFRTYSFSHFDSKSQLRNLVSIL